MKALVLSLGVLLPLGALAEDTHCHTRSATGDLVDVPNATTRGACSEAGGFWLSHGAHCDVRTENNVVVPRNGIDSVKCKAAGGTWHEHGHGHDKHRT